MEDVRTKDARLLRELLALVPWRVATHVAVAPPTPTPTPSRSTVTLPVRGPRQVGAYRVAHLVDRPECVVDNSFHPKHGGGASCVREVVLALEPAHAAKDLNHRVFTNTGWGFEEVLEVHREVCGDGSIAWNTGCGTLVARPCDPGRGATWRGDPTVPLEGWSQASLACDSNYGVRVVVADIDARSR